MVQHTVYREFSRWNKRLDQYWKLDNGSEYDRAALLHILDERNFAHKSSSPILRLRELYARSQCGMMSYETLGLAELKLLVAQRGLSVTVEQNNRPWYFRTLLEDDDHDKATFSRFADLQPELRLQIYTHHFNSFPAHANIVVQPPLTAVSKSIRAESLPVFYASCKFNVYIFISGLMHPNRADQLLQHLVAEHFGWIRKINMSLCVWSNDIELSIDLCDARNPVKYSYRSLSGSAAACITQQCRDDLSSELNTFFGVAVAREGVVKLQQDELKQVPEILRRIFAQHNIRP